MINPMMNARAQVGDWISGTTQEDEKFIGFVQSNNEHGTVSVWVTQSDREAIVGSTIQAKLAKVKKLPEPKLSSEEEVRSLIELALGTHDKQWFEQLRAELAIVSTGVVLSVASATIKNFKERF